MSAVEKLPNNTTSTDVFFNLLSQNDHINLGKAQWNAMRHVESYYDTQPMSCFDDAIFSSNYWAVPSKRNSFGGFNWAGILEKDNANYPWVLLLKLSLYQRVEVQKYSTSSYEQVIGFSRLFQPFLKKEKILYGQEDTPIIPAEVVNKERLHDWCTELANNNVKNADIWRLWSSLILNCAETLPSNMAFLRFNFTKPWAAYKIDEKRLSAEQQYLNKLLGKNASRTSVQSYKPFSASTVAKLIDAAIPLITEHNSALIDIINTFQSNYPMDSTRKENQNNKGFSSKKHVKAMKNVIEKNRHVIQFFPDLNGELNDVFHHNSFGISWICDLHSMCTAAAVWIILLTTGIRNVDIRHNLVRDCVVKDPDGELLNYLITDIQKTGINDHPIPVPPLTIQAIDFLNNINLAPMEVPNLVSRLKGLQNNKEWHISTGTALNQSLRKFASNFDINLLDDLQDDENPEGVAHRARVTLANWIGTNSPLAVMIVKRIFGHTNEVMPDDYLKNNRDVMKERSRIQQETYEDLSDEVSDSIVEGKFSGGLKQKIIEDVETVIDTLVKENNSLVGEELRMTLKENIKKVFLSRLSNGEILGMQTPLGFICMRDPKSTSPAPCSAKQQNQKMKNKDIDRRFMRALQASTLPDLDNCQGSGCQHSFLYDNPVTKMLLDTFHYYVNYLKGVGQFSIEHIDIEAQNFIHLYYPPLKDVYPDIEDKINVEDRT